MSAKRTPLCLALFEDITPLSCLTSSFHETISEYEVVL